jgi:hypothetical protein
VSLGSTIKRIFGGKASPDDESDEQEEYGAPDPGVTELRRPADPYGGDLNAVAHELEDKGPRDPNP